MVSFLITDVLYDESDRSGGIIEPRSAGGRLGADGYVHGVGTLEVDAVAYIPFGGGFLETGYSGKQGSGAKNGYV